MKRGGTMGKQLTTIEKNNLIGTFTKNELFILKMFSGYRKTEDQSRLNKDLVISSQLINKFARDLSEMFAGLYTAETFIEPYIYCDIAFEQRMHNLLKEVIEKLITIMSYVGEMSQKGFDENRSREIEKILGELSLMLRFDVVATPVEEMEMDNGKAVDIGNVYFQLDKLNNYNRDHFLVKSLWQNSARKILPRYHGNEDVAIVMQGPIDYDNDFTLEALLRYRRVYPDVTIVLSTWEGEVREDFAHIAEAVGIVIHENEKPADGGPWNLRYQLTSSLGGLKKAKELCEPQYVLKTRTDQVFLLPEFILYFKNMLRTFPVQCEGMKERIIFLGGYGTMCTHPFRITDFMSFGTTEDIENLYSAPENFDRLIYTYYDNDIKRAGYFDVLKKGFDDNFASVSSMNEAQRAAILNDIGRKQDPESYVIQSFCERIVYKKKLSESDDVLMLYWKFIKNCAVFINSDDLLLFWDKYSYKFFDLGSNVFEGGLNHATWLSMYYSDI